MIFKIAGVDFSEFIQDGTYECMHDPDIASWEDANFKTHFLRQSNRIAGTVTLGMASKENETFKGMIRIIKSATIDMLTPLTVYVMDDDETKTINAKLSINSIKIRELDNGYATAVVRLKFEEA